MTQLIFKEAGKVPGLIMSRYKAQCKECREKIAIDDTKYPF